MPFGLANINLCRIFRADIFIYEARFEHNKEHRLKRKINGHFKKLKKVGDNQGCTFYSNDEIGNGSFQKFSQNKANQTILITISYT